MDILLATILGVMGVVNVGNPFSLNPGFSIGGKSEQVHNILDDLSGVLGALLLLTKRYKRILTIQVHHEVLMAHTISSKPTPRTLAMTCIRQEMPGP